MSATPITFYGIMNLLPVRFGVGNANRERITSDVMKGYTAMADHVFVLHTHSDPHQIARLCRILIKSCPDCFILISHDKNAVPLDEAILPRNRIAVLSGEGGRGDFSIVDGYLAALAWLAETRIAYSWVSNLSGQDYPVASLKGFMERCASGTDVDGFVHHFDAFCIDTQMMAPWTWTHDEGIRRYHYSYRRILPVLSAYQRALIKPCRHLLDAFQLKWHINPSYGLMLGSFCASAPFGPSFRCYAGSFWTTINHRCANYLLDFVDTRSDIVDYFRKVLIPDEAFIQTILANNTSLRLVNNNLRYIDMRTSRHGRPKLLTEKDLPLIRSADAFFARKFDGRESQLFEVLDERAAA